MADITQNEIDTANVALTMPAHSDDAKAAEVENLRKYLVAQVSSSNIPAAERENLIAKINSDLSGNVSASIMQLYSEISTEMRQDIEEKKAADDQRILQEIMEVNTGTPQPAPVMLTADAREHIRIRSEGIDIHNAKKLEQFAETLVDANIPAEIHHETVQAVAVMLVSDDLKPARDAYNNTSVKAKEVANTEIEQTNQRAKNLQHNQMLSQQDKEVCTNVCTFGTSAEVPVQLAVKQLDTHPLDIKTKEKSIAVIAKANTEQRERIEHEIPNIYKFLKQDVATRLQTMKSPDAIVTVALDAMHQENAAQTAHTRYHMSDDQKAAVEGFIAAKGKVMTEELAGLAVGIDLEMKKGQKIGSKEYEADLAIRTETAYEAIKKAEKDTKPNASKAALEKEVIKKSLQTADVNKLHVTQINHLTDKQFTNMTHQVYNESYGFMASVQDAWNNTTKAISNTANAAAIWWNKEDDIKADLAEFRKTKLSHMVTKDGKKIFDLNGNAEHDVAVIKAAMDKAGLSFGDYDKGNDGHINEQDLVAAAKALAFKDHAIFAEEYKGGHPSPDNTPSQAQIAANKAKSAAKSPTHS